MNVTKSLLTLLYMTLGASVHAQLAFTDATVEAGLLPSTPDQGINGLRGGGCAADFNNDGWQDLFIPARQFRPDQLFINNGDGTFTNRAAEWGIAASTKSGGVCAGDFNNDGWVDIYMTVYLPVGKHRLYRNNGDGTFTNIANSAGVQQTSTVSPDGNGACFGDYDLDGDLDLMVSGGGGSFNITAGNRLFRNNGDETFTDVTFTDIGLTPRITTAKGFTPAFVRFALSFSM